MKLRLALLTVDLGFRFHVHVVTDRGFKIREDLMMHMAKLCINNATVTT